jgi:plastocyanin
MKRKWMLSCLAFFLIFFSSTTAFAQTGLGANTDQAVQDATTNTPQAAITVNIESTGFNPSSVTIEAGDSIVFQNQTSSTITITAGSPFYIFLPIILRTNQMTASQMTLPTGPASAPANSPFDANTTIPAGGSVTKPFPDTGTYAFYLHDDPTYKLGITVQPAKDFTLAPDPLSRSIYIGQSTSYTLNTTALNGFVRPVTLSVTGLPDGVTPAWDTNPATPPAAQVLTLTTTSTTLPGSYDLVVSGTDGMRTHTTSITLVVNALPDLSVTSIAFDPDIAATGQPFNLSTQVTNLGPGLALPFTVAWQITPLGQADPILNGTWDVASLAAGASATLSITPTAPAPGTYTVSVRADSNFILPDPNRTNNTRQAELGITGRLDTCGDITANTTWAYATYVVTCNININSGATLTVAPGTIVKFQGTTSIVVNGALNVPGTLEHLVFFTSLIDDSVGGDTDNDGGANSPARGDWNSIVVAPTGTVSLAYTNIRYGGYYHWDHGWSGEQTPLHVYNGGSAVLDHVTFAQNGGYGIHVEPSSTSQLSVTHSSIETSELNGIRVDGIAGKAITITNNTFTGNGSAGLAAVSLTFSGGSVTALDGNSGSGNAINGIQVNGTLGMDTTLPGNPLFAYVINGGLTVDSGKTLTLSPDAVVKFNSAGETLAVNGNLIANGTATSPVTFTSLMDDTAGGDTNNDGNASSPAQGDWNSIIVAPEGTTTLTYANIAYGGYYHWDHGWSGNDIMLLLQGSASATLHHTVIRESNGLAISATGNSGTASLTIADSTIADNNSTGININNTGTYTLSVSRTIIRNNETGITISGSSINATVNHCNIYANTSLGVNNATPSLVDATYNWWGAAAGPTPPGNGVSGNVNFAHYLTAPEVLP